MKVKRYIMVLFVFLFPTLNACGPGTGSALPGAGIGAGAGALIGQAIGHNTEATLIGAVVGMTLGYIVGNEMDKYDQQQMFQTIDQNKSGVPASWENPDSGNQYMVTPQPAYTPAGQPDVVCRKAEILATIDGKTEKTYTTACRDAQSGEWTLQQ